MAEAESSEISESETESEEVFPAKKPKLSQQIKTHIGAAKYECTFISEWCKTYPVEAVRNDTHLFFCIPCGKSLSCSH